MLSTVNTSMFSVDNFYNYLNDYCFTSIKDIKLKTFFPHGSRSIHSIQTLSPANGDKLTGSSLVHDQEPISIEYLMNWRESSTLTSGYSDPAVLVLFKNLSPTDFIFRHFSAVRTPLLFHSERNSTEVQLFEDNYFHAVHYFYHGLIARDWFRHYKHYSTARGANAKRLGMYCRDATGSREYRLDLLKQLIPYKDDLYYKLQDPIIKLDLENFDDTITQAYELSDTEYNSDSSATIVTGDCKLFDIQIVPETLFRTTKTHLTEKVFKPIVMKQPFIIAGCPNTLAYLKSYGFRTFDGLWDESYDSIIDGDERMAAIINVVERLTKLDDASYERIIDRAKSIVEHNHKLFFSEAFEAQMLNELHTNLDTAIKKRDDDFVNMPGGTWFMYLDKLHQDGHDITDFNRKRIAQIIGYLTEHNPDVAAAILEKYDHLL